MKQQTKDTSITNSDCGMSNYFNCLGSLLVGFEIASCKHLGGRLYTKNTMKDMNVCHVRRAGNMAN